MKHLKIGLAYTPYHVENPTPIESYNSQKMEKAIMGLKTALSEWAKEVILLPVNEDFITQAKASQVDLIFNYATGVQEKNSQVITAALLEKTGLPYTASGMKSHFIALHKDLAKFTFQSRGIPTPAFQVFQQVDEPLQENLHFPLFVKPIHEGSSFGIDARSVVRNPRELKDKVQEIILAYGQPALVEEFIAGREFTVAVWGNQEPDILPILELQFSNPDNINTQANKNKRAMEQICPAFLAETTVSQIKKIAVEAFKALQCRDYARVDFRMDQAGRLFVLEINTLPSLKEDRSSFVTMAKAAGYGYSDLIKEISNLALARYYGQLMEKVPGV